MTFDATASNTGHVSAACISLQQRMCRAPLWSACLQYVGEVILSEVFNALNIEALKPGGYMVFSRFKKHFHEVPHGSYETLSYLDNCSVASDAQALSMIAEWLEKTVGLAEALVEHQLEDYKEFT